MTRTDHLELRESVVTARTFFWIFITIALLMAGAGIGMSRPGIKTRVPLPDQERVRAIEFWMRCG